jgi:peptide/nickel transport system substrate-binding protein
MPGIPDGNPDVIQGTIIGDQAQSAQMVASNQADYDENVLPTDRLAELQSKYKSQIRYFTTPSTYYFFMNQRTPPFNDLKVRQAVNYAIDRSQLVKIFGGLGKPTENFLPPTYPQYNKINPYPYNLAKAKQLVASSGTKGMKVTVYGERDVQVSSAAVTYLQGVLKSLGYNASLRLLNSGNYFTVIDNQSTKAQIGYDDWFEDYPYPSDWFNVLQNGENITKIHNNNDSNVDVPAINKGIDKLDHLPPSQALSPAVNNGWAQIDNTLMTKYASEAPYLNRLLTAFFSTRMNMSCDINDDDYDDIAQFCLK